MTPGSAARAALVKEPRLDLLTREFDRLAGDGP
jgi:hypothetical protein